MAIALTAVAIIISISACSAGGKRMKIDARFLNMNQANFYVYSHEGLLEGIDTISVQAGRFTYEKELLGEGIIVIVFPNYATMPVFVSPGDNISIEANAAHLRTMEIKGSKDNELYTEWRTMADKMSPVEMRKHAENFINDHPESPVARWLVQQYFITGDKPDHNKAKGMLKKMLAATDNNVHVAKMLYKLNEIGQLAIGARMPRINAKDIDGKPILNGTYNTGKTVICLWATWNYDSQYMLRQIASNQRFGSADKKIDHVITISLDPDVEQCRRTLKNCGAESLTTICDTMMWESPIIKAMAFTVVPDNIRLDNGKVTAIHAPVSDLLK